MDEADWLPDLSERFFPGKWEQGFLPHSLSRCLRHWHFFADSLSRVASMISGGQRSVAPLVMWFHSLRCGSILGDFLCLVCVASSSEACYAHLKPVRPLLFDAEMSTVSQRKPWASGLRSAAAPAHQTKAEPKCLNQ